MKVSEKVLLFVEEKKGKEGNVFKTFSTTISTKRDNEYVNKSLEVRFNTDNIPQSSLNKLSSSKCYTLEVENGWLGVREYTSKDNEVKKVLYLFIDKATIKDSKPVNKNSQNNDLPF